MKWDRVGQVGGVGKSGCGSGMIEMETGAHLWVRGRMGSVTLFTESQGRIGRSKPSAPDFTFPDKVGQPTPFQAGWASRLAASPQGEPVFGGGGVLGGRGVPPDAPAASPAAWFTAPDLTLGICALNPAGPGSGPGLGR